MLDSQTNEHQQLYRGKTLVNKDDNIHKSEALKQQDKRTLALSVSTK